MRALFFNLKKLYPTVLATKKDSKATNKHHSYLSFCVAMPAQPTI